ncbi:hypothetical protein ACIQBJ_18535 [Kitasatospora sp. NPDC088391]|uniref:hypothetical protein n=1 Tax=Kitasatospora sp. NPDC088391 TaxID=3364074 RepID=UPI00382CA644
MLSRGRILAPAVLAAAVGVLAVGCSQHGGQPVRRVPTTWGPGYRNVEELDAHSDLAVAGRFSRNLGEQTDGSGLTRTDFEFTVTAQLSDHRGDAAGARTVLVRQLGGKGVQYGDDTLFREGEDAVLFLQRFGPGQYTVIDGPNGRFGLSGPAGDEATVSPFNDGTARFSGTLGRLGALLARR